MRENPVIVADLGRKAASDLLETAMRTVTLLRDPEDQASILFAVSCAVLGAYTACLVRARRCDQRAAIAFALEKISMATKAANNG